MNDDDIMQDFYGSAKDGNAYLASLDDETAGKTLWRSLIMNE